MIYAKKFETKSSFCAYSTFKVVVEELRGADRIADDEYKTVLLAFINCLIISTPELKGGKQTWI